MSLRRIIKKVFPHLPTFLRHQLARRLVVIPPNLPDGFEFTIAKEKEDLENAFRLLHDSYVEQKYMKPLESGLRITKFHSMPTTTTLVAKFHGRVIGTLSILRDSMMGLPLDSAFDLNSVREKYSHIAEISSLAIDKKFRGEHGYMLWPLLKFFYRYASEYMGLDAIIVGVHPKWADFYRGILCFRQIHAHMVPNYEFANGQPVVGYFLDLKTAPLEFANVYSGKPTRNNLLAYFGAPKLESHFIMPERSFNRVADPVMTPELLSYFFVERSEVFLNLDRKEAQAIVQSYPEKEFMLVLSKLTARAGFLPRSELRFSTRCRAIANVGGSSQLFEVLDVSRSGLKVKGRFAEGEIQLQVQISNFDVAEVRVRAMNSYEDSTGQTISGLRVMKATKEWDSFIDHLEMVFSSASRGA